MGDAFPSAIPSLPGAFLALSEVEDTLLIVLIQLCVIIAAARVFAALFQRLGQPIVVGEILAGLILGPSMLRVLGLVLPEGAMGTVRDAWATVFNLQVAPVFGVMSQLGLIFLLFLIGLEFDFSHVKRSGRASLLISITGIILPFGMGYALAVVMHDHVAPAIDLRGFALFMGTAMSITAIPILGRIMMELDIARSRLGAITITSAAIDDACGWILLATVSAMVRAAFHPGDTLLMLAESIGFALGMIFIARPLLKRWARAALKRGGGNLGLIDLAVLLIVMFLCAIATNLIGIFSIFGAFILGAVLSGEHEFREAVRSQLSRFITAFFLPIFFTYTGLRTDVGTLEGWMLWGFALAVSAVAILGKFGGCTLAARLGGLSWRQSSCVGVMMNTRALMELIVINVGHDLGVIPSSVFCMLVFMAVLTTVMTTPILVRAARGTELEPLIEQSPFRKGTRHDQPSVGG